MFKHLTHELGIRYFFVQQTEAIIECYYWSKCREQLTVGSSAQLIISIIGPIFLILKEYYVAGVGKILTYRRRRYDACVERVVSYIYMKGKLHSTILFSKQDTTGKLTHIGKSS